MTGRRLILIVLLMLGISAQAGAASYPLIVQLSPFGSITGIVASLGGTLVDSIPGANTYLLSVPVVPTPLMAWLLGIQSMEPNLGLTLPSFVQVGVLAVPPGTPPDWYKYQPSMTVIHSQDALPYSTGKGVVVADLNSKVDVGHPALIGHLTSGYDFIANNPMGSAAINQSSSSFVDQSSSSFIDQSSSSFIDGENPAYSHGTFCAGIIAVVAPDSMIMPLRVFDDQGQGDIFNISKAIRYAVQQGAQVINMSFGTLQTSDTLKSAVGFALSHGVLLAASAGNNNTSSPQYPAAYGGVMTAASTDLFDWKASFSNYGSSVFVDAPGVNIFSAYPGGYYSVASGTSFSAPAVAGTAALIRSLRTTGIANSISGGSVNIDSNNPNYAGQLGYGRIDVLQAVKPN